MSGIATTPSLWFQRQGELSSRVALELTRARERCMVRFTGGCGHMSSEDADGLMELFARAFSGFGGAVLFGGTRMLRRDDHQVIVPGITEIPSRIRTQCPECIILGIIPIATKVDVSMELGLVVANNPSEPYVTIVHPDQQHCVAVQVASDHSEAWDAEFEECIRITEHFRDFAGWQSLLVCYNGGTVTERELLATANRGWPVLLIDGSGRTTERYVRDHAFLGLHPNVRVAQRDADDVRRVLHEFDVVSDAPHQPVLRIVERR